MIDTQPARNPATTAARSARNPPRVDRRRSGVGVPSWPTRGWLLLVVVVAFALLTSRPAPAQQAPIDSGLDVVMLVDVSGSMWLKTGWAPGVNSVGPPGNDPDRLRWDAVKLVLDLLVDEDRLLVLPFNHECPAKLSDTGEAIPGELPRTLTELSGATPTRIREIRDKLREKLTSFIHVQQLGPRNGEFNGDEGGTALLASLRKASRELRSVRAPGRKTVVILLTDGDESSGKDLKVIDSPDEQAIADNTWRTDPVLQSLGDKTTPVYTMPLGDDISLGGQRFLFDLARFSGGTNIPIKTNNQLVSELRDLIWSLRTCFVLTESFTFVRPGQASSGDLTGTIDLGAILSDVPVAPAAATVRTAVPKTLLERRVAWAPRPDAASSWRVPWSTNEPVGVTLFGKPIADQAGLRPSGYAYQYWDFRVGGAMTMARVEQLTGQELVLSYEGTPSPLRRIEGRFVKRMAAKFVINLPRDRFYRNEPIPVRVDIQSLVGANPGLANVRLAAKVRLLASDRSPTGVEAVLTRQGDSFVIAEGHALTAADIPPSPELLDYYYLDVEIRTSGRSSVGQKPSTYSHRLPLRLIEIENTIPLRAPPTDLTLDRDVGELDVPVETQFPWNKPLKLAIQLRSLPKLATADAPIDRRFLESDAIETGSAQLVDGRLKVKLKLRPVAERLPEVGVYERGGLRFVAADAGTPLRVTTWDRVYGSDQDRHYHEVPYGLRVGTVGLRFKPTTGAELSVGAGRARDDSEIRLELARPDQPVGADASLTLKLVPVAPDGKGVRFTAEELWIQPPSGGPLVSGRRQALPLSAFGEPLVIHFEPRPANHKDPKTLVGRHAYRLEARGERFDPLDLPVILQIGRPKIVAEWKSPDQNPELAPGSEWQSEVKARMEWLPGGELPFEFSPTSELPIAAGLAREVVSYQGGERSWILKSSAPNGPWTPHTLKFKLPVDVARFDYYQGELRLLFLDEPEVTLRFKVGINGLSSVGPLLDETKVKAFQQAGIELPAQRLVPTAEVRLNQWFDTTSRHTIAIRNLLNSKLRPELLKVEFRGPEFPNNAGPYLVNEKEFSSPSPRDYVALPKRTVRAGETADTLLVDFDLPKIVNATPGEPYVSEIVISYSDPTRQIAPQEARLKLYVTFVEAKNAVRTATSEDEK